MDQLLSPHRNDAKNRAEIDLIAEFDLEFGQSDNWDDATGLHPERNLFIQSHPLNIQDY